MFAAGTALSYSGCGVERATLHPARLSVLKRLIDVKGGDVAAEAVLAVLDNVLQRGLQPRKPARRVHQDPTSARGVTRLQTSSHRVAQVLVLPVADAEVVVVVAVVVAVVVVGNIVGVAVRGNNYLRGLWEPLLVLLVVGFVDNRLLLLHLPPLSPLGLLRLRASLLLLPRLPLGGLALYSMLSSPFLAASLSSTTSSTSPPRSSISA